MNEGSKTIQASYATATITAGDKVYQYIIFIDAHRHNKETGEREMITPVDVSVSEYVQDKVREIVWRIMEKNDMFGVSDIGAVAILLAGEDGDGGITVKDIQEQLEERGVSAKIVVKGGLKRKIYSKKFCDVSACLIPKRGKSVA